MRRERALSPLTSAMGPAAGYGAAGGVAVGLDAAPGVMNGTDPLPAGDAALPIRLKTYTPSRAKTDW